MIFDNPFLNALVVIASITFFISAFIVIIVTVPQIKLKQDEEENEYKVVAKFTKVGKIGKRIFIISTLIFVVCIIILGSVIIKEINTTLGH